MSTQFTLGRALVIGIANYPKVNKLPLAVLNDARDVDEFLRSPEYCGYPKGNVELLLDGKARADDIRAALGRLARSCRPDDTAVLFFSGHGGRIEGDAGSYLIPFDCDANRLRETAISSEEFADLLSAIPAGRLVVLLDACHSGGAEVKAGLPLAVMKAGFDERMYDTLSKGVGRVIMASSRSTEVSLVLPGQPNSLFTRHLLDALKGAATRPGEDVVRVFDVFQYVSDKVPADAPTQHPIFKAHDLETNFALALHRGGTKAPAPGQGTATPAPAARPNSLDPKAKIAIKRGLLTRWDDLADYLEIPTADKATWQKGLEPKGILDWLEERGRLGKLRDAFNYLGYDDLIGVLDSHPR
jgi:hypothetical protein